MGIARGFVSKHCQAKQAKSQNTNKLSTLEIRLVSHSPHPLSVSPLRLGFCLSLTLFSFFSSHFPSLSIWTIIINHGTVAELTFFFCAVLFSFVVWVFFFLSEKGLLLLCFEIMATTNPFDLLGDDAEDPSQLIAAEQLKAAAAAATAPPKKDQAKPGARSGAPAQLPSKPLPPSQAG